MKVNRLFLGAIAVGALLLGAASPSLAQSAVLTGRGSDSRITVRSRPSTTAYSPGYGLPGDPVEVLAERIGDDRFIWYFIEFDRTGEKGWVRGDSVSFDGRPGSGGGGSNPDDGYYDPGYGRPGTYYDRGYQQGLRDVRAGRPYNPDAIAQRLPEDLAEEYLTGYGDGYLSTVGSTLVNFETRDYAVRVYRAGTGRQLRMNVYNKRTRITELIGSPAVEVRTSNEPTTYVNTGGEIQYFVTDLDDEDYELTINENGRIIYQQQAI